MRTPIENPNASPSPLGWARSLRFRLTLWYTLVLAVILIGAILLVFLDMRRALREQTDGFLVTEAHRIAAVAVGRPGDPPDLQEAVSVPDPDLGVLPRPISQRDRERLRFDVAYARLVTRAGGRPLAVSPDLARRPALTGSLDSLLGITGQGARLAFAGPDEERMMRVYTAPVCLNTGDAVLQVAVPWDHNADLLQRLATLLGLGGALVLLLAAGGGWVLVGRTLQPISRIVAEVDRLDAAALPEAMLPAATETDSEIGRLVATLNHMTTRLHRAFEVQRRAAEAQQRFAADASHELRTPLTILRGEMELALARPRAADTYRATLTSAVEEVARMSRIVDGLSFLAHRDAGRLSPVPDDETVDLAALSRAVVTELTPQAEEKGAALRAETPAPSPLARGNAGQLQQLLRNLVHNAVKYTSPGGSITVVVQGTAGGEAFVEVRDTGIGIAPEDLPFVFDRFWRADRSRSSEGTGLGLAISAEIAAAHGGELTVRSELGAGSCFRLQLPT